jgi:flotillin
MIEIVFAALPLLMPLLVFLGLIVLLAILFRRVVKTNMVHIVQSRRKTTPFGAGQNSGNVYYRWPAWVPFFGITVIELPVSNFDLSLESYEAYDKDRVPFVVDVVAFFRINDTARAAQRVENVRELENQLMQIIQGAVRKILAGSDIDTIMLERAQFGTQFTDEVSTQLQEWGVEPVKAMELMDIRDSHESQVIHNIMAKKKSHIEMESRVEVANNHKQAENAEIDAKRAVDIRKQEAEQVVGERTAEKDKAVGIADQMARQEILTQERETRERDMKVKRVEQVNQAEITRDEQIVAAEQEQKTTVIIAEGELEAQRREAAGIEAVGLARAEAEKAMQLAPVTAQIELAREIGTNEGYQRYLAILEAVKGYIEVGSKQAAALEAADVKVIANAGSPSEGMTGAMNLFTSKGGTDLAAMLEAFAQSPLGSDILSKFVTENSDPGSQPPAANTPPAKPKA